jgi:hypothetical protein
MEIVVQSTLFSAQECKTINYCIQFLRVHTLSDFALAGGTRIDPSFLTLSPSLLSSRSTLLEPLQDKPLTASALALWVRANRLWCNTVSGCLHQLLGKWLFPGSKLRRTWPYYYYDPDSRTLWFRTLEDKKVFTVHHSVSSSTTSSTSHPTSFHHQPAIQPSLVPMILPANSVPVATMHRDLEHHWHSSPTFNPPVWYASASNSDSRFPPAESSSLAIPASTPTYIWTQSSHYSHQHAWRGWKYTNYCIWWVSQTKYGQRHLCLGLSCSRWATMVEV